ncbi:hypothetical protein ACIOG8_35115 [Streptomyces erythrochromogenes]|uniref:hypothetical protein n=1 Tax=Streptomyces erythrochromogenes TaxID=285574 RepID=UPI00382C297C
MFWRRLGTPGADASATAAPPSAVPAERVGPLPPEPWDPAAPVARLPVTNDGLQPLELVLEPYCWSEWLEPGSKVTVVTMGRPDTNRPWTGTSVPDEPFELQYLADTLVVWPYGDLVLLLDAAGNELYRYP